MEHKYGMLKQRFGLLESHRFEVQDEETVNELITATCIIQNMCLDDNDLSESVLTDDEVEHRRYRNRNTKNKRPRCGFSMIVPATPCFFFLAR